MAAVMDPERSNKSQRPVRSPSNAQINGGEMANTAAASRRTPLWLSGSTPPPSDGLSEVREEAP
jgi:hypothetical protein